MKTNYQLPTTELTQAGTFFANLGLECPWVGEDAWCDLEEQVIRSPVRPCGDIDDGAVTWDEAYCPPAVPAAAIVFAQWLADSINDGSVKLDQVYAASIHYHSDQLIYLWSVSGWPHKCDSCGRQDSPAVRGETKSRLEAAVALILGVWQAMGGESDA